MPALVVRVRERFGPRRLLGEALLAFLVVVLIPSSASRAVETAAGVAGGEKADQVTMDCIVVKLGRPHVTMATVIASNEQRSYLVTTLDPGCAQRVAYVRGDRSHGIKVRLVDLNEAAVLRDFKVPVPRDIVILSIERGNLVPATVTAGNLPDKVSVAAPPSESPFDETAPRRQKIIPVTSAGARQAYVAGPWGVSAGAGVFDQRSGALLGVILGGISDESTFEPRVEYVVAPSSEIRTVLPYLAENVGLSTDAKLAPPPTAESIVNAAVLPLLHHEQIIGEPGFQAIGAAVAIARRGNAVLLATALPEDFSDLAVQVRNADGALRAAPIKILMRDRISGLAVFTLMSDKLVIPMFRSAAPGAPLVQIDFGFCSWQEGTAPIECAPRQTARGIKNYAPPSDAPVRLVIPPGEYLLDPAEVGFHDDGAPLIDTEHSAIVGLRIPSLLPMIMSMDEVATRLDAMQLGARIEIVR